jgi:hypothetical protein
MEPQSACLGTQSAVHGSLPRANESKRAVLLWQTCRHLHGSSEHLGGKQPTDVARLLSPLRALLSDFKVAGSDKACSGIRYFPVFMCGDWPRSGQEQIHA